MRIEDFWRLREGDELHVRGKHFVVARVAETVYEPRVQRRVTYMVENEHGENIKATDPWVPEILVIRMEDPYPPLYMKRLEYVVTGIEETDHAWEFIEIGIEELIEHFGGTIVEIDG